MKQVPTICTMHQWKSDRNVQGADETRLRIEKHLEGLHEIANQQE